MTSKEAKVEELLDRLVDPSWWDVYSVKTPTNYWEKFPELLNELSSIVKPEKNGIEKNGSLIKPLDKCSLKYLIGFPSLLLSRAIMEHYKLDEGNAHYIRGIVEETMLSYKDELIRHHVENLLNGGDGFCS